jgi:hypothetical protein
MEQWPHCIAYALDKLPSHFSGEDAEFIQRFVRQWGGIDPDTLARVVRNGEGKDRIFALLALGYTGTPQAHASLMPLLESDNPVEQWASALELGKMRESRALPTLLSILTEFQPPESTAVDAGLNHEWLYPVPRILGRWGEPSSVPPLRRALQKAVQAELAIPGPVPEERLVAGKRIAAQRHTRRDEWNAFQVEIVYALGGLAAFGALTGLAGAETHLDLWRVHLIMGHLHGRHAISGLLIWHDMPELREEASLLLERCFGLNADERAKSLLAYEIEKGSTIASLYQTERLRAEGQIY